MSLTMLLVDYQRNSGENRKFTHFLQDALCENDSGFPDSIAKRAGEIFALLNEHTDRENWFMVYRGTIHDMIARDQKIILLLKEISEHSGDVAHDRPDVVWSLDFKRTLAQDAMRTATEAENHYKSRKDELMKIMALTPLEEDGHDIQTALLFAMAMEQDLISKHEHCHNMVRHFLDRMGNDGHPEIYFQAKSACELSLKSLGEYMVTVYELLDALIDRSCQIDARR